MRKNAIACHRKNVEAVQGYLAHKKTFDHPLFLITPPYIAHCMGTCTAKGGWSLFSLFLSPRSLASLHLELEGLAQKKAPTPLGPLGAGVE